MSKSTPASPSYDAEIERLAGEAAGSSDAAKRAEAELIDRIDFALGSVGRPTPERSDEILKRIRATTAHAGEHLAKKFDIRAAEAGKPRKSRSEKSRARWRADKARDEEIFSFISGLLRAKQPIRLTDKEARTVRSAKIEIAKARTVETRIVPEVGLPHWDHTDPHLKMLAWGMASSDLRATPFSLHLNALVFANAKTDPRGVGRYLQDRLGRHLRSRLDEVPPFWFAVEAAMGVEPHLHGAIVVPPGKEDVIRKALKAAGGPWDPVRQLTLSTARDPATWVSYATKWLYGTRRRVDDANTTGATNSVRAKAREWHQSARKTGKVI